MSDQVRISPYNINTIPTREVMKLKKNINLGIISWSNKCKHKCCIVDIKENLIWELMG